MQLLLCYDNEGVYVNTYGRRTKNAPLEWGELPSSVGKQFSIVNSNLTPLFSLHIHESGMSLVKVLHLEKSNQIIYLKLYFKQPSLPKFQGFY